MARVLTFTNNKGGTGKSTLCINSAYVTAQMGWRVLVIDLTSQRTSSLIFYGEEVDDLDDKDTVLALLTSECDIETLIFESDKGLDIIASSISMAKAARHLAMLPEGRETVLQKALEKLADKYDYIFLDSPGDLNELTTNVLAPANIVFIPTRLNRTDFSCTQATLRFIEEAKSYIGIRPTRVILNMLDDRYLPGGIWSTSHTGKLYQLAQEKFGDVLSSVTIPDSNDIRTAFDRGLTLVEYKPEGSITQRLQEFVNHEVIHDRSQPGT